MRLGRQNYKIDYGHLFFLTLITGYDYLKLGLKHLD